MAKNALPEAGSIEELFSSLLGRDVTVGEGKAPSPGDEYCGVACYRRDDGELAAVVVCDIAFAAHAGSCLAMVPAGTAEEMAKSGELSESAIENAHEVFNIIAVTLAQKDGPPVRLADAVFGKDAPSEDAAKGLGAAGSSTAFEVEIDGYGKGQLSLVLC